MKPYQNSVRFKDNIRQISLVDAVAARALEQVAPSSRLVIDADGALNIDLGGGSLFYPGEPRLAAERQVAQFLDAPLRLYCPQGQIQDTPCDSLNLHMGAMAERLAAVPRSEARAPFGGFVIVFGIGLGHHIKLLAERMEFKTLIVVEPHDELIVHGLHVLDWKELTRSLARRGRDIRLVRGGDLLSPLLDSLRGRAFPFFDGSYIFSHYQSEAFTALARQIDPDRNLIMGRGWFEDQMTMLRNTTLNFSRVGFRIQRARVASQRVLPAFVVGAGPSVDAQLEDIRRCRDQVVLISASSSLKVLLEHGIRPDIHCELENSAGLADVAETLAAKHGGLSDIVLYGSSTIDPRIAPHFKSATYFFRTGLSSTPFYGQGCEQAKFADPTSGNAAVHCALSLGFREIYLFGMDFGARDPKQHHSRHSVYFTYEKESEVATYTPYDLNAQVPGNFGGQVFSGWVLNWGRQSLSNAIQETRNARVFNCSDGSLIPLAKPMAVEALSFLPATTSQQQDVANGLDGLEFCLTPRAGVEAVERLRVAFRAFLETCHEIVTGAKTSASPLQAMMVELGDRLIDALGGLEQSEPAAWYSVIGSTTAMLSGAFHFASILADSQDAKAALLEGLSEGFQRLGRLADVEFDAVLVQITPVSPL